ncbi:hypothetical protein RDV84_13055 [Lysobacter yananisis]|uniref:Uncharacterized protein n=1 Tax=Lysobacter yananisis TaxID=1003114 RepID=A0ABY9PH09_9GAMM|nr:hypothetical protein [Lysobacter yananisis]WMT05728.1 hypothetical protein RDV84_13055 [Lysobacter yananisis]
MLECTPHSVFSWNYSVSGLQLGTAELTFEPLSDRGAIAIDEVRFDIRKQGWLDASWTLERDGNTVATAKRRGMLGRSFDLTHTGTVLLLKPQTLLVRDYHLLLGDTVVGTIEPEHPLTRKARVKCDATVAETVQLFSFWLVAMIWRSTTDASPT